MYLLGIVVLRVARYCIELFKVERKCYCCMFLSVYQLLHPNGLFDPCMFKLSNNYKEIDRYYATCKVIDFISDKSQKILYNANVWLRKTLGNHCNGGLPNFTIQILIISHDIIIKKASKQKFAKVYLLKVADEKFAKVFLCQTLAPYSSLLSR